MGGIREYFGNIASALTTTAKGGKLTGRKSIVYGGQAADVFLIAAKDGDSLNVYEVKAAEIIGRLAPAK